MNALRYALSFVIPDPGKGTELLVYMSIYMRNDAKSLTLYALSRLSKNTLPNSYDEILSSDAKTQKGPYIIAHAGATLSILGTNPFHNPLIPSSCLIIPINRTVEVTSAPE